MRQVVLVLLGCLAGTAMSAAAANKGSEHCGDSGVWIQILGAGGPELNDAQSGASYLVWIDDQARLLVDTAPGSSLRFDESGAAFKDLDAIVFTHLHVDHVADFPAFIKGSIYAERERPLPVLGPAGNADFPNTATFINRMIGPEGAFAYLQDFLTYKSRGGYKVAPRNVPATGRRRWARFGSDNLRLSAIPVSHGEVPAIAWRVETADKVIVFTGDFNNQKNVISEFAKNADALVVSHAIDENARGVARELHVTPTQIGRIAAQAGARMVILGHRTNRTRGRESQTRAAIEEYFDGPLLFANDLECWGL